MEYISISFLYLNHYEITNNKESLEKAEIYINKGLEIEQNNMALLNNKGILLYLQYKENKESNNKNYLKESLEYLNRSIEKNTLKKDIGETYYYLSLVYDEYAKLDENISGYSKEECEKKSDEYLQKSKDLGFKVYLVRNCYLKQRFASPVKTSLLGVKQFTVFNYSPMRLYGIVRNHIILWKKFHLPFKKRYHIVSHYIFRQAFNIVFGEKNKMLKIKALLFGLIDGLLSRKSRINMFK